jgi:hypothetical protein
MHAYSKQMQIVIIGGGNEVVNIAKEMATVGQEALTEAGAVIVPVKFRGTKRLSDDEIR